MFKKKKNEQGVEAGVVDNASTTEKDHFKGEIMNGPIVCCPFADQVF